MKNLLPLFLMLCLAASGCSKQKTIESTAQGVWTEENARQHVLNRQDSSTWDMEMLERDIPHIDYFLNKSQLPLAGTFPEPNYFHQVEGTWASTGSLSGKRQINDKDIQYIAFYAGRNDVNAPYIGDKEDEIFFLLLALTDVDEDEDESDSMISSRNTPDVMGYGRFYTKDSRIDYISFLTADRNNYAIVNTRLFDLKHGRTVLIAPQKDGTFRSMQLAPPLMSSDKVEWYVDSVIAEQTVRDFFQAPGNIQ